VLLAILGLPADQTALDRLAGTAVGAALALLAYLLWPSWEGSSASEKFAVLFEAQGRYASALLRAYSRPAGPVPARLHALQLAARRARSDAEASAGRLADEPDRPPMTGELARALTSAVHRMAQAALTLDASVAQQRRVGQPADQPHAALDQLAAGLAESTGTLAASLREMLPPGRLPPLRRLQAAIIPVDDAASDALFAPPTASWTPSIPPPTYCAGMSTAIRSTAIRGVRDPEAPAAGPAQRPRRRPPLAAALRRTPANAPG